jgi:hypothetical protein
MGTSAILGLIQLALRIIGTAVCANKAVDLNRNAMGWGFFGFFFPIIAMIWVHSIKPIIIWDKEPPQN